MKHLSKKIGILIISLTLSFTIIFILLQHFSSNLGLKMPVTTTNIPLNTISFATPDKNFKHFFEPTADTDAIWSPEWLSQPVINHINRDTINDPREFTVRKPENTYRILTVGDSFTYGQFVKTEENYSSQLEKLLNTSFHCQNFSTFEIINLGVMGYDVAYSMERVKRRGLKYSPDLIVYLINNWNITSLNEQRIPLQEFLNTKGIPTSDLNNKQQTNPAVVLAMETVQKTFGMKYILDSHATAIASLRNIYSGPFLMVSRPFEPSLHTYVNETAQQNSIIYDNTLEGIMDYPEALLPDRHPNAYGHKLIAEAILKSLRTHVFSSCTVLTH